MSHHLPSNPSPSHLVPCNLFSPGQPEESCRIKSDHIPPLLQTLRRLPSHSVKRKAFIFTVTPSPCTPYSCHTGFLAHPWADSACSHHRALASACNMLPQIFTGSLSHHFHHPGGSARALALAASAGPGSKDHTPPPRGLLTPLFTCKTRNPMFCITFPSKTQKNHPVLFGCCCVLHFSVGSGGRICFGKGTVSTEGKRENSPLHLPPHSINNSSKSTEAFNDTGIMTTLFLALSRGQ